MRQPVAMRLDAVRLLARLGGRPGLSRLRLAVVAAVLLGALVTVGAPFTVAASDHGAPERVVAEPPIQALPHPARIRHQRLAALPRSIGAPTITSRERHAHQHAHRGRRPEPSRDRDRTDPQASRWRGLAFDACHAPSQHAMDRWRATSPYRGVGIYIGGALRACRQRHLTRHWVTRQLDRGWKLMPLWVGPQASCTGYHRRISARPGRHRRFPHAHRQGIWQAHGAASAARALGIPADSTLFYDIEPFTPRTHRCRASALRFLTAWTRQLHREGFRSGVYSTVGSAIAMLSRARHHDRGAYAAPDRVWFAWVNGRMGPDMGGYVRPRGWEQHRRAHQYALDIARSYGGVRMHIDSSLVDFGVSAVARRARRAKGPCDPRLDRRGFRPLHRGQRGAHVRDVHCLLRVSGHPRRGADRAGRPAAAYDALTRRAVRGFQRDRHLPPTGRTDRATWTALLATGATPVLKRGSTGPPVRRVQRALNAALPGAISVTGRFGAPTATRVRHYQARLGHRPTGVLTHAAWSALQHGRLHAPHHKHKQAHRHGHRRHGGRHHAHHHAHKHRHHRHHRH